MGVRHRILIHSLTVDGEYQTYGGDTVRCLKDEGDGLFTCEFIATTANRRHLLGQCQVWTSDGKWFRMPGGINDITGERT